MISSACGYVIKPCYIDSSCGLTGCVTRLEELKGSLALNTILPRLLLACLLCLLCFVLFFKLLAASPEGRALVCWFGAAVSTWLERISSSLSLGPTSYF